VGVGLCHNFSYALLAGEPRILENQTTNLRVRSSNLFGRPIVIFPEIPIGKTVGRTRQFFFPSHRRSSRSFRLLHLPQVSPRSAAIWRQLSEGIGAPIPASASRRVLRFCEVVTERAAPGGNWSNQSLQRIPPASSGAGAVLGMSCDVLSDRKLRAHTFGT
jgi:hypothetical protein